MSRSGIPSRLQKCAMAAATMPLFLFAGKKCCAKQKQQEEDTTSEGVKTKDNVSRFSYRPRSEPKKEDEYNPNSLESLYKINWKHPIGKGAFGSVYSATDRRTKEVFALKKMAKKLTNHESFQREMGALEQLRKTGGHPNICGMLEHFDHDDFYILILDLVTGGEMFDHLYTLGAYSEADAARLVREIASALSFLHGIGVVHGDLKPENLMLSTSNPSDAVIKVVDFGSAHVEMVKDRDDTIKKFTEQSPSNKNRNNTPRHTMAYCPPERLKRNRQKQQPHHTSNVDASLDMWSIGIILYIMLTGLHPFDLNGQSTDAEIENRIVTHQDPPFHNSPVTSHLSKASIDLIQKLMAWNPNNRITALDMLEHPWINGAANKDKMEHINKKLSMYRHYKSSLEAKVFADIVSWSSNNNDKISKRTSLIERSFRTFDTQRRGYITTRDLNKLTNNVQKNKPEQQLNENDSSLSLSDYSDMLAENMVNRYFPKDHLIYHEGARGDHMYFINSGIIQVSCKNGSIVTRGQGDFFGEGSLLHQKKVRSATIQCVTPVHAIEVSREYFEKYLTNSSDLDLKISLREKDKTRRRNRAKTILGLQSNLTPRTFRKGEYLYQSGEEGNELFILKEGEVDVTVDDRCVFTLTKPGNLCGEHSLVTGRLRNTSAVCKSEVCQMQVMRSKDFKALMIHSPRLDESIREICLRREFQKALVYKTKKHFPSGAEDLKEAFEAADEDNINKISLKNVARILEGYDPNITEGEFSEILNSLDLDQSGAVSFEEFQRIFGMDEAQDSAM